MLNNYRNYNLFDEVKKKIMLASRVIKVLKNK